MADPQSQHPNADRLALLYRISQTFNSSLDLDQVLNLVMDEVIVATRAERGFLMLREPLGQPGGELVFRAARGLDQQAIEQPEFQVSRSVIEHVAQEGRPLLTSNAQDDEWLSERRSVVILGLRSVLCVPLQHKNITLGVIYVDNRIQAGIFTREDLELLTAIAANAAVAIENARLYRLAVEKGRMERELQMARELQASLLPQQLPSVPGWEFAAHWQPARQVAGDFFDFVPIASEVTPGVVRLVIADVADKGMPAAIFMALSRSIVRASTYHLSQLNEGIYQANNLLTSDASDHMFVTLFFAQLDPPSGELRYVNAGHNPPLLYRADSGEVEALTRSGMALGVEQDTPYQQHSVHMAEGDFVLLYTDGLTEAENRQGRPFTEARLRALLQQQAGQPAADVSATVLSKLREYMGGDEPGDDVTLVVVRRQETGG